MLMRRRPARMARGAADQTAMMMMMMMMVCGVLLLLLHVSLLGVGEVDSSM
jgi:hypothetical protein